MKYGMYLIKGGLFIKPTNSEQPYLYEDYNKCKAMCEMCYGLNNCEPREYII